MFAHYTAIARAVPLPMVVYNIPSRCGVDLSLATLVRLAANPAVVAVKEATGNVLRSSEIASTLGDRLTILSGDDALTLPIMAIRMATNFAVPPPRTAPIKSRVSR